MAFVTTTSPDLYATTSNLEEIPAGADPLQYADDDKMNQILVGLTALHGWASGVPVSETANGHFLALAAGSSAAVSVAAGVRIRQSSGALDYSYNTGAYARLLSKLTLASQATGDIMYASAADTWTRLAAGTNGHVLTLSGGVPTWAAAGGGGGGIADSDNVVWTGEHSFEGVSFNVNPLATFAGNVEIATTKTLKSGANTLISGDKLQVGQLSGAVTAALGGTGQAGGYAVGDMLYASGASAISKLAAGAVGTMMIGQGAATAPAWSADGVLTSLTLTSGSNMKLLAWTSDTKYLAFAEAAASPSYRGIKGQEGTGTDKVGGALYIAGGQGTGTGRGGHITFQTSTGIGTGTTLRAMTDRWSILGGDATNTYSGHFVPATTNVYDIGSPTVGDLSGTYVRSTYVATSMNAPKWADSSDSTTHWTFASGAANFTSGGTERVKFDASRLSAKFGSGSYPASYDGVSIGSSGSVAFHAVSTSTTLFSGLNAENDAGGALFAAIWGSSASGTRFGLTLANSAEIRTAQPMLLGTSGANTVHFGTNDIARIKLGTDAEAASTTAVYLSVNGTMQRVSVGAADSESAGYRSLRIPN